MGMNGGVRFVQLRSEYPKDNAKNPLYFDVCEKGRWFNKMPRSVLFKRLSNCPRFIPSTADLLWLFGEEGKQGWEGFRVYLFMKSNPDDPTTNSFTFKISLLRAIAHYHRPLSGPAQMCEANFAEEHRDNPEFVRQIKDVGELNDYDGYFYLSPSWNKVVSELLQKKPEWREEHELARKRLMERRR